MKVALVCIAKDEDYYMEEWIDYNLKLGFDSIYVYQNDWICKLERPNLIKIDFPGLVQQMNSYNHFLDNFKKDYDWAAFIDCDEYIFLKKHKNIKDLLEEYDNPYGLALNWVFFGGCGIEKRIEGEENSLLKQFTKRQIGLEQHIKSIIKTSTDARFFLPHNPHHQLMNLDREFFNGPFNKNKTNDTAYIAHFHHKTYEDWLIRCKRGRADGSPKQYPEDWAKTIEVGWPDLCATEDTTGRDFMYDTK